MPPYRVRVILGRQLVTGADAGVEQAALKEMAMRRQSS